MVHSAWYVPGDWSLPQWWTDGVTVRVGFVACYKDQQYFYNSRFVREILGHDGGMTTLPKIDGVGPQDAKRGVT